MYTQNTTNLPRLYCYPLAQAAIVSHLKYCSTPLTESDVYLHYEVESIPPLKLSWPLICFD